METKEGPSDAYEVFSQFRASLNTRNHHERESTARTYAIQEKPPELDSNINRNRHVIYPECTYQTSTTSSSRSSNTQSSSSEDKPLGFMSRMRTGILDLIKKDRSESSTPRVSSSRYRAFIIDRILGSNINNSTSVHEGTEEAVEYVEYETDDDWVCVELGRDDPVRIEHPICTLAHPVEFSLSIPYNSVQKLRKIGEGAIGLVYRARYQDQLVALKEVAPHNYETKHGMKFISSLTSELHVLGAVGKHKNVLRCYGGSVTPPHVFTLCQLMDTTLGDLLHRQRTGPMALSVEQSLLIVRDILSGLNHLHQWSPPIVHRDLKPDNILLDRRLHACVADFGLSRTKSHSYINTQQTHAGTPEYLAPEILSGKINEKMDIYSVGVILWECLTGLRPWDGYHPFAVLLNVAEGSRLPLPTDIFPIGNDDGEFCPMRRVRILLESCWDGNVSRRPSCIMLIEEVDDILLGIYTQC
eukprot:g8856.t1